MICYLDITAIFVKPTLIFLLFTLVHSLMASHKFKARLFAKVPALSPWYRIIYNVTSLIFLGWWAVSLPQSGELYRATGLLFWILIVVQIVFGWLLLKSVFAQNGMIFLGLKQVVIKLKKGRNPDYLDEPQRGKLVTTGLYRYMRHPMYTFVILLMAASPIMTTNLAYSILIFGIYFWVGSLFEERNLIKRFGDDYRAYQKKVSRFIPKLFS